MTTSHKKILLNIEESFTVCLCVIRPREIKKKATFVFCSGQYLFASLTYISVLCFFRKREAEEKEATFCFYYFFQGFPSRSYDRTNKLTEDANSVESFGVSITIG